MGECPALDRVVPGSKPGGPILRIYFSLKLTDPLFMGFFPKQWVVDIGTHCEIHILDGDSLGDIKVEGLNDKGKEEVLKTLKKFRRHVLKEDKAALEKVIERLAGKEKVEVTG